MQTTGAAALQQPPTYGREYYRHEKHEKEEKREKHEKGTLSGAFTGGVILIVLGMAFYLSQLGYISATRWWAWFVVALGAVIIVQDLYYIGKGRRRGGGIIGGLVLLAVGYALATDIVTFWPLVLIAIGIGIIASAIIARSKSPVPATP